MTRLRQGIALPTLALLVVTCVWGSTFFLIKDLVATIPATDFLGLRFAIASAAVLTLRFGVLRRAAPRTWRRGFALGAIFSTGQILQTTGLETTAASVSGFLTGLYVVFTPLLVAALLRQSVGARVWTAVGLATAGLAFLSLQGMAVGTGELLTVLGALAYAMHIVFVGRWAPQEEPAQLAYIQILSTGLILGALALPGGVALPQSPKAWVVVVYMALIAGLAVAVLQTWAQSRLTATTAAIIMTTEPVFATAFAVAFGGETLTWRLIGGGALVLTAMMLVETEPSPSQARADGEAGLAGREETVTQDSELG